MKKLLALVICFCLLFMGVGNYQVEASSKDMNAVWITTVYNIDWPKKKDNVEEQKKEIIIMLDEFKSVGINTVMFQARPKGDSLYKSNINPWSDVLTGTQGKDPGYDPLAFVIQEAHKRGINVHAWLNPYRITTSGTDVNALSNSHPAKNNPSWVIAHNGALYYNPELPEVKQHISDTVGEIVSNYDVDGIVFDDYFYPRSYPLPQGEGRDGNVANARRNHINETVALVNNKIKGIKSNVEFGISPSGIWKNKSSDSSGSDTRGNESYYSDYGDTRTWIKNNWIDYVAPQIYWNIGYTIADYSKLVQWWANEVIGTNVDLIIGHGIYKDEVAMEIDKQLELNRQYTQIKGSVFYSTSDLLSNRQGSKDKIKAVLKSFSDVNSHWAKDQIQQFVYKGYVNGYQDGTFKPNNSMTRAEFVKLTNKLFGFTDIGTENFADVSESNWFYDEIRIAMKAGYIQGKSAKIFDPNSPITREEVATIMSNINNKADGNLDKIIKYKDYGKISNWAKSNVEGVVESGYMNGYEDNTFRPKNNITRAEAVVTLSRIK